MRRTGFVGVLALMVLGLLALTADLSAEEAMKYPATRRVDHVDDYHGTKVADPYRWLEDDVRKSNDVADWVAEQNKVSDAYLKSIPERDVLQKKLTDLWNYEKFSAPFKAGRRYFYTRNDGLQNQSVLYTMDSLEGEPRVLLDPNTWSKDGTVALWDTLTGDPRGRFRWGIGPVQALVLSADGMLAAAAGSTGRIAVWDVDAG